MTATQRKLPPEFIEKVRRLCPQTADPGLRLLHRELDRYAEGDTDLDNQIVAILWDLRTKAEKSLPPTLILEMLDGGKAVELRQMAQNAAELVALHEEGCRLYES